MSVVKIAIVNDTLRKVVNVTKYNEGAMPQDKGDLKYVPALDWMAPEVEYGWTDETKTVRAICGDCESFDENGIIVFNESEYVIEHKNILKQDLADYRWSMTRGTVGDLPAVSYVRGTAIFHNEDARVRLTESIAALKEIGYSPTDEFKFKDANDEFKDILKSEVAGDSTSTPKVLSWLAMQTNTEQVFFDRESSVRNSIEALTTKDEIDNFNVVAELDVLVKIVLMSDPSSFSYPIKYYNQDNPA